MYKRSGRGNKFGARKVVTPEHTFDSQKEYMRYCQLKLMLRAKEISELTLQPQFRLDVNNQHICKYTADFSYIDTKTSSLIVEDVKGGKATDTRDSKIRRKLLKAIYNIDVVIV